VSTSDDELEAPGAELLSCLATHADTFLAGMTLETYLLPKNIGLPCRPGDKRQLKAQDVTSKLVRFDILRMVPKNNLFCIKSM